jgi:ankyrin repeat protein
MMLKYGFEYCGRPLLLDRVCRDSTPLILAAYCGNLDACRLLVQHKADLTARSWCPQITRAPHARQPHAQSCRDGTALQNAIMRNKADVVAYLRSTTSASAAAAAAH